MQDLQYGNHGKRLRWQPELENLMNKPNQVHRIFVVLEGRHCAQIQEMISKIKKSKNWRVLKGEKNNNHKRTLRIFCFITNILNTKQLQTWLNVYLSQQNGLILGYKFLCNLENLWKCFCFGRGAYKGQSKVFMVDTLRHFLHETIFNYNNKIVIFHHFS